MNIWPRSFTPRQWGRRLRQNKPLLLLLLCALVLGAALAGVCMGSVKIPLREVFAAFTGGEVPQRSYSILCHVRLPRVLAGALVGAALAVSGVVLQAVLNNPLAGPNIIGVNAGSGLFVLGAAVLFPGAAQLVPLAAFAGALTACLVIYGLAVRTGASRITIVLAGVAVSGFFGAGSDAITTLCPEAALGASTFMVGGFSGVTLENIRFAVWYILAGLVLALALSYDMNILALGDEMATSLGLSVKACRALFILAAAVLAGGAVSIGGLLGFVGLIVPHAARFVAGEDNRLLVPVSALLGAAFVLGCDLLSRLLFAPYEIPVGILMNFIGGPFFLWLLLRQRRHKSS